MTLPVLLNLDVKDAFPSVPVGPLMEVVRDCVADERLLALVELLVRGADATNTIGIPQGSALSPAHLDLYLSVGLDAPWSIPPESPLPLRYVDNIACLAGSVSEGRRKVARCRDLLWALDLHLRGGQTTELLGFRVSLSNRLMQYGTTDAALDSIRGRLEEAHKEPNPPVAAQSALMGWVNSVGPSFDSSRSAEAVRSVLSCASTAADR